jgi:hypothetical protein
MPVAPPPMSCYTRLHDPVAHAKSEQEAKEVRKAVGRGVALGGGRALGWGLGIGRWACACLRA